MVSLYKHRGAGITEATDVWALGMIAFELFTGGVVGVYRDNSPNTTDEVRMNDILTMEPRIQFIREKPVIDVISKLLTKDPKLRIKLNRLPDGLQSMELFANIPMEEMESRSFPAPQLPLRTLYRTSKKLRAPLHLKGFEWQAPGYSVRMSYSSDEQVEEEATAKATKILPLFVPSIREVQELVQEEVEQLVQEEVKELVQEEVLTEFMQEEVDELMQQKVEGHLQEEVEEMQVVVKDNTMLKETLLNLNNRIEKFLHKNTSLRKPFDVSRGAIPSVFYFHCPLCEPAIHKKGSKPVQGKFSRGKLVVTNKGKNSDFKSIHAHFNTKHRIYKLKFNAKPASTEQIKIMG